MLVIAVLFASEAGAQASVPDEGGGSWTLAYQSITVHDHTDYRGVRNPVGKTQSHVVFAGVDYGLTDKLAISVGVPYIKSKYVGPFPHLHGDFPGHQDEPVIDPGPFQAPAHPLGDVDEPGPLPGQDLGAVVMDGKRFDSGNDGSHGALLGSTTIAAREDAARRPKRPERPVSS